jgi:hypothetical protein
MAIVKRNDNAREVKPLSMDWAPAAEARKIKIEKRTVKRMAYPSSNVAAGSNTLLSPATCPSLERSDDVRFSSHARAGTARRFSSICLPLLRPPRKSRSARYGGRAIRTRRCQKNQNCSFVPYLFIQVQRAHFLSRGSCLRCDRGVGSSIFGDHRVQHDYEC